MGEIRLTEAGAMALRLAAGENLRIGGVDDSDRMYLSDNLKIVDADGKALVLLNCQHERWQEYGFCRAGRGQARCVDCQVIFHGGTWAPCQCAPFPSAAFTCHKCEFSTLTPSLEECVEGGPCEWVRR